MHVHMSLVTTAFVERTAQAARAAAASSIRGVPPCRVSIQARNYSQTTPSESRSRLLSAYSSMSTTRGAAHISAAAAPATSTAAEPATSAVTEDAAAKPDQPEPEDILVQYLVLRRDLWRELDWPLGSVIAQACHASTAALWLGRYKPESKAYCASIDTMTKVVLEVKGETQLRNLAEKLTVAEVAHKLWIEQPENFATCLATQPARRSEVSQYFKKLNLCKGTL